MKDVIALVLVALISIGVCWASVGNNFSISKRTSIPPIYEKGDFSLYGVSLEQPVVIYTDNICTSCAGLKKYFVDHKVAYLEVNIDSSASARNLFDQLNVKHTPVVLLGDVLVQGFDKIVISSELQQLGLI